MADWWLSGGINPADCVAAYQAIGVDSYAASKVNLANPGTYDLVKGDYDPTWNKDYGWQTTSNTQFLLTGYVPDLSVAHSYFVRFSDNTVASNYTLMGVNKGSWYLLLQGNRLDGKAGYWNGSSLLVEPALTSGVIGISDRSAFRNGVKETGAISKPTAPTNDEQLRIFRYNLGASLLAKIQAIAIYNVALTDAQAVAVVEAMNALSGAPQPQTNIPVFMAHYRRLRSQ